MEDNKEKEDNFITFFAKVYAGRVDRVLVVILAQIVLAQFLIFFMGGNYLTFKSLVGNFIGAMLTVALAVWLKKKYKIADNR